MVPLPAAMQEAFAVGVHPAMFRCGTIAQVVGVDVIRPNTGKLKELSRICVRVRFKDTGEMDWWTLSDYAKGYWKFVAPVRNVKKNSVAWTDVS